MEGIMRVRNLLLAAVLAGTLLVAACAVPTWVSTAEAIAQTAVPIAGSIVDIIDPALGPLVSIIESGFNALVKTLDAYKAQPTASSLQAVQAAFAAVNQNVAQLEAAAQIKNPGTATVVASVVQLLNQAVVEIAALIPPAAASAVMGAEAPRLTVQRQAKGWTAKDFKRQFNQIVQGDLRFKTF